MCTLGCVKVKVSGHTESLSQLSTSLTFELMEGLDLKNMVTEFGGVISKDGQLVKAGDYIKFADVRTCILYMLYTHTCLCILVLVYRSCMVNYSFVVRWNHTPFALSRISTDLELKMSIIALY